MRELTFYVRAGSKLITDWTCLNQAAYSFAKRTICFNNLWNICKTISGKSISGGFQIRKGVSTKNSKINKGGGLLFGTGE